MASIILPAVATGLVGGSVGKIGAAVITAAATAAGSYIDQAFLIPALTGGSGGHGGRPLDGIRFQTAEEGVPLPWLHGPRVRVSGNLIWASEVRSQRVTFNDAPVYWYYLDLAVGLGEPPTDSGCLSIKKVFGAGKVVYDVDGDEDSHRFDDLLLFDGASAQTPSALQEVALGVGEVPSYAGTAYAQFENLKLDDFGNAIPSFSFIVEAEASLDLQTLISRIMDRAGYAAAEYSVDSSLTQAIGGYVVMPGGLRGALEELIMYFGLTVRETAGVIEFLPPPSSATTIPTADILEPVEVSDTNDETGLAAEVSVSYHDDTADYEKRAGSFRSQATPNRTIEVLDLSLTLSPTDARSFAAQRWAKLWTERKTADIILPPSFITAQEGDLHTFTQDTVAYLLRADKVSFGYDGQVRITYTVLSTTPGRTAAPSYDFVSLDTPDSNATHPEQYTPPALTTEVLQLPPLLTSAADAIDPRFHLAQITTLSDAPFLGAEVYVSPTSGGTYVTTDHRSATQATMGEVSVQLDASTGSPSHVSGNGSFRVELDAGALESATEDEIFDGRNVALVGDEVIGFTDATLISGTTYELSGIIRGLRNTDVATWAVSTRFVLLDTNLLQVSYDPGWIGSTRYYKVVPIGAVPADVSEIAVALTGENLKPWNPANVEGTVDTYSNWHISWQRRTRRPWNTLGGVAVPVDDQPERYEVDIMDGATVVRTMEVLMAAGVVYDIGRQTLDFGGAQSSVTVRVYQISAIMGRGTYTEATLGS